MWCLLSPFSNCVFSISCLGRSGSSLSLGCLANSCTCPVLFLKVILQRRLELDYENSRPEVLHEILVVNALVRFKVGVKNNGGDFAVLQTERRKLFETLFVFGGLEEVLLVFVEISEHLEEVQIFVLGHLDHRVKELFVVNHYGLRLHVVDGEVATNELFGGLSERHQINQALLVHLCIPEQNIDLRRYQHQTLRVSQKVSHVKNLGMSSVLGGQICVEQVVVRQEAHVDVHEAGARKVKTHVVEILGEICVHNFFVAAIHHVVSQQQVHLFDVEIAGCVQNLLHNLERQLAGMLFRLLVCVK